MRLVPKIPKEIPVLGLAFNDENPAQADCLCPKCKSRSMTLSEEWNCSIDFLVTDGWVDLANGNMHPDGDPHKVSAKCAKCGHAWTLRNAMQITSVCFEVSEQ